jgi:hypothetical protein
MAAAGSLGPLELRVTEPGAAEYPILEYGADAELAVDFSDDGEAAIEGRGALIPPPRSSKSRLGFPKPKLCTNVTSAPGRPPGLCRDGPAP